MLSKEKWVFSTRGVDGTLTIGACFVFLAYVLHPAIEFAYERVRAYRAWQALESRQSVDVTNYPMAEEVFGGRGKWDVARIITVLLGVFSLASWGLELSMDLAFYEGDADLMNRPPPVTIRNASDTKGWQVKRQEDLGDTDWRDLPNMFKDGAKSRYYMAANTRYEGSVNGAISVAHWYTEVAKTPGQFYDLNGNTVTVKSLECTGNNAPDAVDLYVGADTKWGSIVECERGPSLTDDLVLLHDDKIVTPPTIIMTSSEGEVFLIVEENSSYPSFLYSIWTVGRETGTSTELHHAFHIAATMRLVEAVVTGIVHGERSGGGCFGVLRKFSETRAPRESIDLRASPFGEHPTGDCVHIQELEHVEVGFDISVNALACFVCLMVLAAISVAWLCSLRSGMGMDLYDRDELIRTVSMSRASAGCSFPSQMRIFVRKEDSGELKVVINDTHGAQSPCARMFRQGCKKANKFDPTLTAAAVATSSDGFASAIVPMRSREVMLDGVRVGPRRSTSHPSRVFGIPRSVSLTASPVPCNASSVPGTPVKYHCSATSVARIGLGNKGERGASFLFDTVYSSGRSESGGTEITQSSSDKVVEGGGTSGAYKPAFSGRWRVAPMPMDVRPSDIEMPRQRDHGRGNVMSQVLPGSTTTGVREGALSLPQVVLGRDRTFGPPFSCPITYSGGKDTSQSTGTYVCDDVCYERKVPLCVKRPVEHEKAFAYHSPSR